MNLYLLTQAVVRGFDTYDSIVVSAPDEATAKTIAPCGCLLPTLHTDCDHDAWCTTPNDVTATLIGLAVEGTKQGIILASYNAG